MIKLPYSPSASAMAIISDGFLMRVHFGSDSPLYQGISMIHPSPLCLTSPRLTGPTPAVPEKFHAYDHGVPRLRVSSITSSDSPLSYPRPIIPGKKAGSLGPESGLVHMKRGS